MSRLERLRALHARIADEILAEQNRRERIAGLATEIEIPADEDPDVTLEIARTRIGGPVRMEDIYTEEQARIAHRWFAAGERSEWVCDAERQYQRVIARRTRERRRQEAS